MTLTLAEGHPNRHSWWTAPVIVSKKLTVHIIVRRYFPGFPQALVTLTLTLTGGHLNWCALKGPATFVPSFMTAVVIMAEKMSTFEFFKILQQPRWPWPWVKVTQTGMVWRALVQITLVPGFITVVVILSEKMSMFEFFEIFTQPLWPWPWVKVTENGMP